MNINKKISIQERLFALQDIEYAKFQVKLTPGITLDSCIGVRVPVLRNLAKQLIKENDYMDFLNELPHKYYDENMLHGIILSLLKNYDQCINLVEKFLPFVDNWAVCDIMSPKIFKKEPDKLLEKIKTWSKSDHIYTFRFGIELLMSFYLDENFKKEYLNIPLNNKNTNQYYANMMVAWFYATALSKKWDETLPYITNFKLDVWTHNKTIQKAKESYRITTDQKEILTKYKK